MAVWSKRFSKEENKLLEKFNASISFDQKLYSQDIQGTLAHISMLEKAGLLKPEEVNMLSKALLELKEQIQAGEIEFSDEQEDIHMAVEELVTGKVGPVGGRMHTARSRNDQVALDLRLYTREQIDVLKGLLKTLIECLLSLARQYKEAILPGYTHLQRAQPISLAHWFLAYAHMFVRDRKRLENSRDLLNESPLGAGALATSGFPIDRFETSRALDFKKPVSNSLDAVSDRDYVIEVLCDCSIILMHLSRLCEELILWNSMEYGFIELDDAYCTGSSIMPQKKNPDLLELIRGKTGRVYGDLFSLLTVMKGLPLAYNKDLQEDKEALFDAIETTRDCLTILPGLLSSTDYKTEVMEEACLFGYLNATDLADYLTEKGLPFREAYQIVGSLVKDLQKEGISLSDLPLEAYRNYSSLFEDDLYECIDIHNCLQKRNVYGGPARERIEEQIDELESLLYE